jgi:hypothetical protein
MIADLDTPVFVLDLTLPEQEALAQAREIRALCPSAAILMLIEEGSSNKEIACRLNIAVQTVKNHVHKILNKPAALEFPQHPLDHRSTRRRRGLACHHRVIAGDRAGQAAEQQCFSGPQERR